MKSAVAIPIPEGKRAFQVMIAYSDFSAGRRAMDACQLLVAELGGDVEFCSSMWRFEMLQVSKLKRIAARDAIEADMVIVATNAEELPHEIKKWIQAWTPHKRGQTAALVALFDILGGGFAETHPVHTFLKQA